VKWSIIPIVALLLFSISCISVDQCGGIIDPSGEVTVNGAGNTKDEAKADALDSAVSAIVGIITAINDGQLCAEGCVLKDYGINIVSVKYTEILAIPATSVQIAGNTTTLAPLPPSPPRVQQYLATLTFTFWTECEEEEEEEG